MMKATVLGLTALSLAGYAWAETPALIDATDAKAIVELMQDEGYKAKVDVDDDGSLGIASGAGGVEFNVYFKACDDDQTNCELLVFNAGFDLINGSTEAAMTEWNQTRWTKAYLDNEEDPFLELPVNAIFGISERNFRDTLKWYAQELTDFAAHIGWDDEEPAYNFETGLDPI